MNTAGDGYPNKEAEEQLREFESRYRVLFEESPDGILLIDAESLRLIDFNDKACRLLGYTANELAKLSFAEIEAIQPQEINEQMAAILAQWGMTFETRLRTKDGRIRDAQIIAKVITISGKKAVHSILRDITEAKQSEALNEALNEITRAINSTLHLETILQVAVAKAAQALGAKTAEIALREGFNVWVSSYVYGLPAERIGSRFSHKPTSIVAKVVDTSRPVIISDAYNDKRFDYQNMRKRKIKSFLAIPLLLKGNVIGELGFAYRDAAVKFSAAQIDFANKLAASVALSIENARLYEDERSVAETLQADLLPPAPPRSDLDIGLVYHSAAPYGRIGGDFYDFIELDHQRLALVVGDVSGKGLQAATYTAMLKYMLRAYLGEATSPGECLTKLNRAVSQRVDIDRFITISLIIVDTGLGSVTYSLAGHPPPIILCQDGRLELLKQSETIPLGVIDNFTYLSSLSSLDEGCSAIMYTDGLLEARSVDGSPFGQDGIVSETSKRSRDPAQQIAEEVVDAAVAHAGGELADDIALVVASRPGR